MGWMQGGVSAEDRLDMADSGRVLRRAFRMLGRYRRGLLAALALLVVWTSALLAGPILVRTAIDRGIRAQDESTLNTTVIGYLVVAFVAYATYRAGIITLARVGEGFLRDLRNRVFAKMLRQSMSYYDRTKAGVLVSRMTSDIDSLAELVQYGLLMFVSAILLLSGSIIVLVVLSWQLFLVLLVILPVIIPASIKFKRDANEAYLQVRDSIAGTLSSLQEGFSGVRVVQAFAREEVEAHRFSQTNFGLYQSHMQSVKVAAWYLPIIDFAGVFTTGLTVGVGGWMVRTDRLTTGTVVAFVLLLSNLFEPVQQLSQLFNMVQSGTASLAKLFELLDSEIEVHERPGSVDLPASGDIEVDGLEFAYGGGSPVLAGIDLVVPNGERLALVGPTGAGKSTLAKLMARLYDPVDGRVQFAGVDLRDASLASLRERIVVVPQEGFLFDGTVADNIRVARPTASDADIEAALRRIGAWESVAGLPEGIHTEVRERGSRLSAGERQLVSLTRAALVDPAVLVLDEATSSLDPGTEVLVEGAMEALMADRTVIVIAHRLSTSERADRVGVVDDGQLRELGSHDELVAQGGAYAALFAAWEQGLAGSTPSEQV
ncbi:MAG: ABC transporter ATP-binding protein [Actinomycetia bacterium]|nr:ABC transporter ATP-binding protein [Actinomycetes bacterium]